MGPRKILAIQLRALGDTVLMTAPLLELHRHFPRATIDVLVTDSWCSVLEGLPGLRKIMGYRRHSDRASRAKAVIRLAFELRKEKYDCVVNFHASPSSSVLSFATGAPLR